MSQGDGEIEMRERKISVGINGTAFPGNRFLIAPQLQLGNASQKHPMIGHDVSRTKPQRFNNMALGFLGAADSILSVTDDRMGGSQAPIQRQRMLALGNA